MCSGVIFAIVLTWFYQHLVCAVSRVLVGFPAHTAMRGISPENQLGPLLGLWPPDELNGNFGAEECQRARQAPLGSC